MEACLASIFSTVTKVRMWLISMKPQKLKSGEMQGICTSIYSVMIPLILFLRKRWKKEERGRTYIIMKIRRDLGTHLIYIFISIAPINSITKPDNRFDCKLQTEGFNSTYGHIVRRQDI